MGDAPGTQPTIDKTASTPFAVVPVVLLLVWWMLGLFDNTTELIPGHDDVLEYCIVLAVVAGLVWGGLSIRASRGWSVANRVLLAFASVLLGLLSVALLSGRIAVIVEGAIDFPSASTKTYPGLLVISRAYQTHGKGAGWDIQTTPVWSDLNVTKADYDSMLAHRGPGDHGRNPDEISSSGFFCARVTLQQSGNALRVMHAGSRTLPTGTVVVCPPAHPESTAFKQP